MKMPLQRPGQKPPVAHRSIRRGVALLVVVAGLATGVLTLRELRRSEVGRGDAGAQSVRALSPWGNQPGAPRKLPANDNTAVFSAAEAGGTDRNLSPADNSSEIDGAPPVPIEATAASSAPIMAWRTLAPEHMPEAPARARASEGLQDVAALRHRVESLLVADPEALQQARDLLNEPDPEIHARNLQILADSFGQD